MSVGGASWKCSIIQARALCYNQIRAKLSPSPVCVCSSFNAVEIIFSHRDWLMVDSYVTHGRMSLYDELLSQNILIWQKQINTQTRHRPTVFAKAYILSAPRYYQLIRIMAARCVCDVYVRTLCFSCQKASLLCFFPVCASANERALSFLCKSFFLNNRTQIY